MTYAWRSTLTLYVVCGTLFLFMWAVLRWERAHPNPVKTYYGEVVPSDSTVTVNIHQCDGSFLLVLMSEARVLPCPSPASQP